MADTVTVTIYYKSGRVETITCDASMARYYEELPFSDTDVTRVTVR